MPPQSVRITEDRGRTLLSSGRLGWLEALDPDAWRPVCPAPGCLEIHPPSGREGPERLPPLQPTGQRPHLDPSRPSAQQPDPHTLPECPGPRATLGIHGPLEALCWDHPESPSVLGQQGATRLGNSAVPRQSGLAIRQGLRSSRISSNCSVYSAIASARSVSADCIHRSFHAASSTTYGSGDVVRGDPPAVIPERLINVVYTHPIPDDQQLSDRALPNTVNRQASGQQPGPRDQPFCSRHSIRAAPDGGAALSRYQDPGARRRNGIGNNDVDGHACPPQDSCANRSNSSRSRALASRMRWRKSVA